MHPTLSVTAIAPDGDGSSGPSTESTASWDIVDRLVIGRAEDCDAVIEVPNVSRHHAEVVVRAGRCGLRDMGSSNGTMINGSDVGESEHWLRSGDVIVLGGAVALRFDDPNATPIAPRLGRLHGVWIDPAINAVWVDARLVEPPLSSRQHELLELLLSADGAIVSRRSIVDRVWADVAAEGVSDEAVAALVKRLRARLATTGRSGGLVESVRGRGFRLHNPTVGRG